MNQITTITPAPSRSTKSIIVSLMLSLLCLLFFPAVASTTGTFRKTGENTGAFDFRASVHFNTARVFARTSRIFADTTDGPYQFNATSVVNNSGIHTEFFPNVKQCPVNQTALQDEVRFKFYPTDPTVPPEENEYFKKSIYVILRKDGNAHSMSYDHYGAAVVDARKGKLPEADAARFAARTREAIRAANAHKVDRSVIIESDLFSLSIRNKDGAVEETGGSIEYMPEVVRKLVDDLRLLSKQLNKAPLADAYLRSNPVEKERFESLRQQREFRFASISGFPPQVRQIVAKAIDQPGDFHPLSQAQYEKLKSQTTLVSYNGSGYVLNLFTARITAFPNRKSVEQYRVNQADTQVEEIRFSFHPRFRQKTLDDLYLTVRKDGEAQAVLNDYYGSKITAIYKGTLPKAEVAGLIARVRAALRKANMPKADDGVIHDGDLFHLSIRLKNNTAEQSSGVIEEVPEVRAVVDELNMLWKRLKETPRADGYVRSVPINRERFELLQREGRLRFASIKDFPLDVQQAVTDSINHPRDFFALSREQFDNLRTQTGFVIHNGSGYELHLLTSQNNADPSSKKD